MGRTIPGMVALLLLTLAVMAGAYADEAKDQPKEQSRPITITFNDVPLGRALELLSKHGLNFVATKDVLDAAPPVSARFKNIPVMNAAKAIVKTAGLYYVIESPKKIRVGK